MFLIRVAVKLAETMRIGLEKCCATEIVRNWTENESDAQTGAVIACTVLGILPSASKKS